MDYNSAKTMSVVAIVFIAIQLVGVVFMGAFYGFFAIMFYTDMGPDPFFCICWGILGTFMLIIPLISLVLALKVHKSISNQRLTDGDKSKIIALIILSFLGGGGLISGIMYIIIMASWSDLVRSSMPHPPAYVHRSHFPPPPPPERGGKYGDVPPPPIGEPPPPGFGG